MNLEVSIVSTSLVAVTDDLQGFRRSNWIVTGYLVTYTGKVAGIQGVLLLRERQVSLLSGPSSVISLGEGFQSLQPSSSSQLSLPAAEPPKLCPSCELRIGHPIHIFSTKVSQYNMSGLPRHRWCRVLLINHRDNV